MQPQLGRRSSHLGRFPPDQRAGTSTATKTAASLPGAAGSRGATVKQPPKSVVREIRTPRSVGTGGGRLPPVTRWALSNERPLYVATRTANEQILLSSEENGEPLASLWRMSLCG